MLSGGGARGAYEVGVIKALIEAGMHFDLVFGTSIGALNAAFLVQDGLSRLEELWTTWRPRYVVRPYFLNLWHMMLGKRWSLFEPQALEDMLTAELDLGRVQQGSMRAGFVITDLCTLKTRLIITDEIKSNRHFVDVLMATCALPLVLPPRRVNGTGMWIDGGIVRNTPVLAALRMGAREIYAVLLHGDDPRSRPANFSQYVTRCVDIALTASAVNGIELVNQCNLLSATGSRVCQPVRLEIFKPRHVSRVGLLNFDPKLSKTLMKEGYEDTVAKLSGGRLPVAGEN